MLTLTPDVLRSAYDYLSSTEPFAKWNLPDGEDVSFKVIRSRNMFGYYLRMARRHFIAVSSANVSTTLMLMSVMAHEMIHLHEHHSTKYRHGEHSAAFARWATQVRHKHGFDV